MRRDHSHWGAMENSPPNASSTSDRLRSADVQLNCSAVTTDLSALSSFGEPSADWSPDRLRTDVLSADGRVCCQMRTDCTPMCWRMERISKKKEENNAKESTLLRALQIIAAHAPICSPRQFAAEAWPDSPAWKQPTKRPKNGGAAFGAPMNSSGAAYLGRLASDGFIERRGDGYALARRGAEFLNGLRGPGSQPVPVPPRPALPPFPTYITPTVYWTGAEILVAAPNGWQPWTWG